MFSLKQHISDSDLEPFQFEDSDGEICELPHVKALTPRQGMRMLVDGDVEGVLTEVAPDVGAMILDLPTHAAEALVRAWMEHSDVVTPDGQPGKPLSSSRSSASTRAPSKRTSRSGGKTSRR